MAVYTVRIGGQSTYIGHVGDDANGKVMRNAIEAKGVDTSHLYTKPGRTAVTQVEIVDGERVFGDYDEGVLSDYCLTNEDIEFIKNYDVVVCDLWGKVEGQFKDLKAAGITTAFDGADRPDDPECQTAMPYTDYLFFSTENGDTPELRAQMQRYAARGPKLVIAMLARSSTSLALSLVKHWPIRWEPATVILLVSCMALRRDSLLNRRWKREPAQRPIP